MDAAARPLRLALLLGCSACLLAGQCLRPVLEAQRTRCRLSIAASAADVGTEGSVNAVKGTPPEYMLASALLGGFRGMFITALWVRAQNMKNDGQYYEMVDLYNIITKLQPGHHQAWAFQAWDLAYNVSVEFDDVGDRVFWVFRGIDLLRRQGIPKTPKVPELYSELAWIFFHKIGQDTDFGHPVYRFHLARQVERAFGGSFDGEMQSRYLADLAPLPRDRAALEAEPAMREAAAAVAAVGLDLRQDAFRLASPQARPEAVRPLFENSPAFAEAARRSALWEVGRRLREDFGMDPAEMARLCTRYGPIDWRLPYAHSLYWASLAQKIHLARRADRLEMKYERLVYFSLIELAKRGKVFYADDGYPFYFPDPRFLDAVVTHMDWMFEAYPAEAKLRGETFDMTGPLSGYSNYLKDAVFESYFEGRLKQSEALLAKFEAVKKSETRGLPLERFILENLEEWLDSPDIQTALALIQTHLLHGYWALAVGDEDGWRQRDRRAAFFHEHYCRKRWNEEKRPNPKDPDYRHHVPPLKDLRRAALAAILLGQVPLHFTPGMMEGLAARLRALDPKLVEEAVDAARKAMEGPPMARPPEESP